MMTGVKSVVTGGKHTLLVKQDDTLWAAGRNGYGQLGTGVTSSDFQKSFVKVMADVKAVSAGYEDTMVVKKDGTLWAAGRNVFGQHGDGSWHKKTSFAQL